MHDVLVVGGSLGGCATAIQLARRGFRVALVERSHSAGRKACGEGLFPAGVAALERLGLAGLGDRGRALTGVQFATNGAAANAAFTDGRTALGIRREILDAALRQAAVDHGVCLRTGVAATGISTTAGKMTAVITTGGTMAARAFVAADGLGSRMRRLAGLDDGRRGTRYGVSAHVACVSDLQPLVQVWFGRGHELYVTPVGDRSANVAILTRRDRMAGFAGHLREAFSELASGHPVLRAGFAIEDEPMAAGPFARGCKRAWRGNLVLVGDAAGFFDGITGEGMPAALLGAERAAAAVAEYLEHGSYAPFRRYERERRALTRNAEVLGRLSLTLGRWPAFAGQAIRNLDARPETFARLVAVNTGDAGLRSLRPRDLLALAPGH
ncbi:MAG: NAD(P)/FAD-dependent oxidoreductase [Dehalococcoidia bacterium]|nr:NAD(P)/FAD-dependent oxidoreductase [Dehalococcoidia bacterium]